VKTSENLQLLCAAGRRIGRVGLICSISPAKDVMRDTLSEVLLNWLQQLPSSVAGIQSRNGIDYDSSETQIRRIICEEFCKQYESSGTISIAQSSGDLKSFRVDYLLLSSHQLWKYPKLLIKQLIISTFIIQGEEHKQWLGTRFATLYLDIANEYYQDEMKYDHTIISLAVQLFTVPSITSNVVSNTNVVADILSILKAYYIQDLYPNDIDLLSNFDESIIFAQG
jgi:hypothetical protein